MPVRILDSMRDALRGRSRDTVLLALALLALTWAYLAVWRATELGWLRLAGAAAGGLLLAWSGLGLLLMLNLHTGPRRPGDTLAAGIILALGGIAGNDAGRRRLPAPRPRHGWNAAPDGGAACPGGILRPAIRSRIGICGCRRFVLYGPPWSCFDTLAATPAGATQCARRFDTPGIPVLPTSWIRRPGREANIHWGSSRPDDGGGHPSPDLSGPAVRSTRQRWQDVDAPLQRQSEPRYGRSQERPGNGHWPKGRALAEK